MVKKEEEFDKDNVFTDEWEYNNPKSKKFFTGNATERRAKEMLGGAEPKKAKKVKLSFGTKIPSDEKITSGKSKYVNQDTGVLNEEALKKLKEDTRNTSDQAYSKFQNVMSKFKKRQSNKANPPDTYKKLPSGGHDHDDFNDSKRKETDEEKIEATQMNEKRAVTLGKVKPPTPKHLVNPKWKSDSTEDDETRRKYIESKRMSRKKKRGAKFDKLEARLKKIRESTPSSNSEMHKKIAELSARVKKLRESSQRSSPSSSEKKHGEQVRMNEGIERLRRHYQQKKPFATPEEAEREKDEESITAEGMGKNRIPHSRVERKPTPKDEFTHSPLARKYLADVMDEKITKPDPDIGSGRGFKDLFEHSKKRTISRENAQKWKSWLEKAKASKETEVECPHCSGKGRMAMSMGYGGGMATCRNCGGKGKGTEFHYTDTEGNMKKSWEIWLEKAKRKKLSIGDKLRLGQDDFDRKEYDKKIVDVNMFGMKQKMPKKETSVSEEEPLEELTDGELTEVEKLKSWESWLEKKDPVDDKEGGDPHEARRKKDRLVNYNETMRSINIGEPFMRDKKRKRPTTEEFMKEKSWEIWLEKANTQTRRSQHDRFNVDDRQSIDNTHTGVTNLPKKHKKTGAHYGMMKPVDEKDTDLRLRVKLPFNEKKRVGDTGVAHKMKPSETKMTMDALLHMMTHDKERFNRMDESWKKMNQKEEERRSENPTPQKLEIQPKPTTEKEQDEEKIGGNEDEPESWKNLKPWEKEILRRGGKLSNRGRKKKKVEKSWESWLETRKDALDPKAKPQSDLYGDTNTATFRNTRVGQKPPNVHDFGDETVDYGSWEQLGNPFEGSTRRKTPKGISRDLAEQSKKRGKWNPSHDGTGVRSIGDRDHDGRTSPNKFDDRRDKLKSWEIWLEKQDPTTGIMSENAKQTGDDLKQYKGIKNDTKRYSSDIQNMYKSWLETRKDGQGDARYANPHETGMEDPRKLQTTKDDFNMEEEKEKEDKKEDEHKPFIQRERNSDKDERS